MAEEDVVESRLTLPDRLDYAAGMTLMADLQERMCAPVVVDAGKVKHLGAFSAQVILAAQKQWEIDEAAFSIVASDPFRSCWTLLGFPQTALEQTDLT